MFLQPELWGIDTFSFFSLSRIFSTDMTAFASTSHPELVKSIKTNCFLRETLNVVKLYIYFQTFQGGLFAVS